MFGAERKTPELGSGLFAVSCEKDGVVFGEDSYRCIFKEYTSAMVAYGAYAHQVMMELWHDVCSCGWEVGEEDIAQRGGAVGGGHLLFLRGPGARLG